MLPSGLSIQYTKKREKEGIKMKFELFMGCLGNGTTLSLFYMYAEI